MSEISTVASTATQIRQELDDLVRADLLGPANGPDEIVDEPTVRGRYIIGVLAPTRSANNADEKRDSLFDEDENIGEDQSDLALGGGDDDDEEGRADSAPPKAVSMMPAAIGLTFTVDGAATAIQVTARWGRYVRTAHPDPERVTKAGKPIRVWQRIPAGDTTTTFPLQNGPLGPWSPDLSCPDVRVSGRVRRRGDEWSITLQLINGQREPQRPKRQSDEYDGKDSAWIFQPELIVTAPDDAPIFSRRPRLNHKADDEARAMAMLYRRDIEFAVGHGVAVHADLALGDWERAIALHTDVMPTYEVAQMTPPTANDIPLLGEVLLDMRDLAQLADGDFATALNGLTAAYADWIEEQATRVANPAPDLALYATAAMMNLDKARTNLERIQAGIDLLAVDPQAAAAFRFANQAMWQQRIHALYADRRRRDEKVTLDAVDQPENRRWRPFQLAFILLNLPSITDIHHPDRSHETGAIADLLWFPTGGGKTEAYLGLTAYTLGLRRLQGDVGGYSGLAGVTVLMRYTLRLLTLQQFQRATALICACEAIRQDELAQGNARWGSEPFRIGLWVGSRSTPNTTEKSEEALNRNAGNFGGPQGTPYQLTTCPWCGSEIQEGPRDLKVETADKGRGRTLIFCSNPLGHCRFSKKQAPTEGLPVLVVDEEIYRRLPALLIATVDKFAQMAWKGETQMLFGRVNGHCTRHGYCSPELSCPPRHRAIGNKFPATQTQPAGPLRPPDLIIQDELHLISGPLGTLVGLYETAIDHLCSWEVDGQRVRPKVIASTATIRRADAQVNQLYLRQVNIFPPSGLDAGDNFFARQRPTSADLPGRRYVGICAPGIRIKTLMIRVYVATMAAAQMLYERYGAAVDPYMTQVGYFNAVRELGGMRRAVDDAVRTRLRAAYLRGLGTRYIEHWGVEELTSRKSAADIPRILNQLEQSFDPNAKKRTALDVLLATNMISVGVDVSRLGLMTVAGQPKNTAEYIQATSRVGRRHPGLVYMVYNWTRPRDLSHYERFEHYHATFYQHVEPLSVTPFSPRALGRGLTGVLVALVRLLGTDFNPNSSAGALDRSHPIVQRAIGVISRRAGLITGSTAVETEVRNELEERIDQWLNRAEQAGSGLKLGYMEARREGVRGLLEQPSGKGWHDFICLNSLRDVEPGVGLLLDNRGMEQQRAATTVVNNDDRNEFAFTGGAHE